MENGIEIQRMEIQSANYFMYFNFTRTIREEKFMEKLDTRRYPKNPWSSNVEYLWIIKLDRIFLPRDINQTDCRENLPIYAFVSSTYLNIRIKYSFKKKET